jgi:hypothetical protein
MAHDRQGAPSPSTEQRATDPATSNGEQPRTSMPRHQGAGEATSNKSRKQPGQNVLEVHRPRSRFPIQWR